MTTSENKPADAEVLMACDRMLELVKSMPREHDYHKVQMAFGALIGCGNDPSLSCAAFARAASMLVSTAGQTVDVHVRSGAQTLVFEGSTGIIRRFEVDDGDLVEVGDTPTAMQ